MRIFGRIADNGPRIGEGAANKAQPFTSVPTLAKPFSYLLNYKKEQIKNGFAD